MSFRIPFAVDAAGVVFSPLTAPKDHKYWCLECMGPVSVKRPRKDRTFRKREFTAHFFHLSDALCAGTGESVTHRAAKRKLKLRLQQELSDGGGFWVSEPCSGFKGNCQNRSVVPRFVRASGSTEVTEEASVEAAGQTFRFDVAVLAGREVRLGFEVYFQHRVPDHKAEALTVPWWEFRAEDILENKPLVPLAHRWSDDLCPACKSLEEREKHLQQDQELKAEIVQERKQQHQRFGEEASKVVQLWQLITSKKYLEDLTGQVQLSPRDRAIQHLKRHGVAYAALKELKFATMLVGCQHCGEEVVFATGKPTLVAEHLQLLNGLVVFPERGLHQHVCVHCGGLHTNAWFWESWKSGQGLKV